MDIPIQIYQVLLRFAEINFGSAGSRIFHARVEGGSNLLAPDQDGLSALLEYALGGSEQTQDAARLPQLLKLPGGDLGFVFARPEGLPDLTYILQASTELKDWVPISPLLNRDSTGNGTEEIRLQGLIPAAVAAGLDVQASTYFRLSISLTPLTP